MIRSVRFGKNTKMIGHNSFSRAYIQGHLQKYLHRKMAGRDAIVKETCYAFEANVNVYAEEPLLKDSIHGLYTMVSGFTISFLRR